MKEGTTSIAWEVLYWSPFSPLAPILSKPFWTNKALSTIILLFKKKTSKLRPKVLELLITPGPTATSLISEMHQLLTKSLSEPEKHWKLGIPEWHLTQITILAHYLDNTTFFLTNIHNYLHFIVLRLTLII